MNAITLRALAGFPQQHEAHYAAIPDGFQHWAPDSWEGVPSEPFSAIEQICHLRDIEVDGYPEQFERAAEFEGRCVSLRSLAHFLCSHDQQHLAGLQWLLGRIEGIRVAQRLP